MKKAAFLDRDGVINIDYGFVNGPDRFDFTPGAPHAIRALNRAGYLVLVVTNQSAIGRGQLSESEFLAFSEWINEQLALHDAHIDRTYYCPHHPLEAVDAYKVDCPCRKPKPGMLLQAASEFDIDKSQSFLIGDHLRDLKAAEAFDIPAYHFWEGSLDAFVTEILAGERLPDRSEALKSL